MTNAAATDPTPPSCIGSPLPDAEYRKGCIPYTRRMRARVRAMPDTVAIGLRASKRPTAPGRPLALPIGQAQERSRGQTN